MNIAILWLYTAEASTRETVNQTTKINRELHYTRGYSVSSIMSRANIRDRGGAEMMRDRDEEETRNTETRGSQEHVSRDR